MSQPLKKEKHPKGESIFNESYGVRLWVAHGTKIKHPRAGVGGMGATTTKTGLCLMTSDKKEGFKMTNNQNIFLLLLLVDQTGEALAELPWK